MMKIFAGKITLIRTGKIISRQARRNYDKALTSSPEYVIIYQAIFRKNKGHTMIYEIAGLRVLIKNKDLFTTRFCEGWISADQNSLPDLCAEATEEAMAEEKAVSPGYPDGYVENICIYRNLCQQLPEYGRFLVHSAVLSYNNEGFAFLGRSGTGKTTHTGLWLQYLPGAEIINGDKPVFQKDGDIFYAFGTPWMGKEARGKNAKVPLKALCFLAQKKENTIRRLTPKETSEKLMTQLLIPQDEKNAIATLELADSLISSVPAYLLECDISETAVRTSFEGMTGKKYENEKQSKGNLL